MAVNLNRDTRTLAATYDSVSDMQFASGCILLDKLAPKTGEIVLDIGCGTGRLGRHLLPIIGPTGRFIGVDPLPERIKIAREKNQYANASFRLGVAEDLGFIATASVDVLYLNWVFHWVEAKDAAMREICRVLRPGGRLGIVLPSKDLSGLATMNRIVDTVLEREPYYNFVHIEKAPQKRNNPTASELMNLFLEAALLVEEVQIKLTKWTYPSAAVVMQYIESSYFGNNLDNVPEILREQARAEILGEFGKQQTAAGLTADHFILYGVASKPPANGKLSSPHPRLARKKSL